MSSEMVCPKCGSDMRTYERNGVVVDQCTECKGLFLDRGELEQLASAENAFYEREGKGGGDRDRDRRDDRDRDRDHDRSHKPKKSKKKSFLENIMENMGE